MSKFFISKISKAKYEAFKIPDDKMYVYICISGDIMTKHDYQRLSKIIESTYSKIGGAKEVKFKGIYNGRSKMIFAWKVYTASYQTIGQIDVFGEYVRHKCSEMKEEDIIEKAREAYKKLANQEISVKEKIQEVESKLTEYYEQNALAHTKAEMFDCVSYPDALHPHQVDAINLVLSNKEIIIGLEAGSGKTLISAVALNYVLDKPTRRALVVVLKSLPEQWAAALRDEGIDQQVDIIHYEAIRSIINFDGKDLAFKEKHKNKWLLDKKYDIIICDELQKARKKSSKVSRSLRFFCEQQKIERRVGLTGTPIYNDSADIYGLLRAITHHPLSEKLTEEDFVLLSEKLGKNMEEQFKKWTAKSIWYRTLADYGLKLTPTDLMMVPVPINSDYIQLYQETIKKAKEMIIQGRNGQDKTINTAMVELRTLSTAHKISTLIKLIDAFNEEGKKVVVFSNFNHKCLNILAGHYGVTPLNGSINSPQAREALKQRFINGTIKEGQNVLLANYEVGGTGLDGLQTVCDTMILADPVWEVGKMIQTIARLRRLKSQFDKVKIVCPFVDTTQYQVGDMVSPTPEYIGELVPIETIMFSSLKRKSEQFDFYLRDENSVNDLDLTNQLSKYESDNAKSQVQSMLYKEIFAHQTKRLIA